MFDQNFYRSACTRMELGAEKIEEMISMIEEKNTKKRFHRPAKVVLLAAAIAAALGVSAFAASPAGQDLWREIFVSFTVVDDTDGAVAIQVEAPNIWVDRVDGRVILSVDGAEEDITEALEQDGTYVHNWENEKARGTVTVEADLTWVVSVETEDGEKFTFTPNNGVLYTATEDEEGNMTLTDPAGARLSDYEVND